MRSKTSHATLAAVTALLAIAAAPVEAAVVYNGGAPDLFGTFYAQAPGAVAMSFTLAGGSNTLTDAHWWGGCFTGPDCAGSADFNLTFYQDSSGSPGAAVASFDVGNANQTATGSSIHTPGTLPFTEYAYSTTFAPTTFTAGTQYWFGISQTGTEPASWGAETTSSAPSGQLAAQTFDGATWIPISGEIAFTLTNDAAGVPEPGTLALLSLGLAGAAAARRKRKT